MEDPWQHQDCHYWACPGILEQNPKPGLPGNAGQ